MFLFLLYGFFILLPAPVESKTLIGLIDRLTFMNAPADYAKVGEFCFTIPEGVRGSIDSEVVIADDGHRLILLKDNDEQNIRNNQTLKRYTPNKRRQLSEMLSDVISVSSQPDLRRFLEEAGSTEAGVTSPPTTEPAPSTLSTEIVDAVITTVGSHNQAGVPHKEGGPITETLKINAAVLDSHVHKDKDGLDGQVHAGEPPKIDLVPAGVAAHPSKVDSNNGKSLPPIVISDDPGRWPSQATTVCDALVERARVTETLKPVGKLSSYHLVLWVEPHINGHRVSLIITRCGADPYAEYRIELKNPGSFLKAHYSCEDQGLLELYTIAFAGGLVLLVPLRKLWSALAHTRKDNPVIDVFFLAAFSYVIHLGLHFMHLFAYAFNGLGFSVLVFLGQLADLVFVVSTCFVISWLLSLSHSNGMFSPSAIRSPTPEEEEDEQNLISTAAPPQFRTADALFTSNTTMQTRLRVARRLLSSLFTATNLLAALAFSTLIVVFLATIKSSTVTDPLTPGWRITNLLWDNTFSGTLLFLSTIVYFVIRYLFAAQLVKEFFRLTPSQIGSNEIAVRRQLALICSFIWLVGLPTLAIVPHPLVTIRHGTQFGLIALNFVVLITLGRCLVDKPSTILNLFMSYRILSTGGDVKKTENSGLVATVGKRYADQSLSGYTTAASSVSHANGPSFPTPAWDNEPDEEEKEDSEPELIDVSQLPSRTSTMFGYSTLG